MQCGELIYQKMSTMLESSERMEDGVKRPEKESIHSGHFMVSHFEAEEQDDEDEVAVPVPEEEPRNQSAPNIQLNLQPVVSLGGFDNNKDTTSQHVIETSLSKLFQCMSLAYRQKLTSPKWNRFKGVRLRWKEKIRLNNVIWRCWHMQFILKQNTLVCQFASPLDVDTHNKPEAVVLEGKYWKRKLAAVTAEYKKWRMFRRNQVLGCVVKDGMDMLPDVDMLDWQPDSNDSNPMMCMMVDQDYMEFMSDTLFTTIQSNQPFAFPDTREIAKGAVIADFIQPSLVQLQPNLDDFMDTLEPLQELFYSRLPPVPEEGVPDDVLLRSLPGGDSSGSYPDLSNKSGSSGSLDSHAGSLPILQQIDHTSQNMGMYQQMAVPYRQPEYISVGVVGSNLDSQVGQSQFANSNLQVQLLPQQQHAYAAVEELSANKQRVSRTPPQSKSRPNQQSQPFLRKQLLPMQQQQQPQQHIQQEEQQVLQQHYNQQQPQQTVTTPDFSLFATQSVFRKMPTHPSSPTRTAASQAKLQTQAYSSQLTPQVQSTTPAQQQAQAQTVISSEPLKMSGPVTQRSYSLPTSSQNPSAAYGPSNLSSLNNLSGGSGSMGNIHMASLSSTVDKNSRPTNEVFAVPKYQKLRNRSRSGSSLIPGSVNSSSGMGGCSGIRNLRPLASTASNPDLSTAQTSALLTHLLTSNFPSRGYDATGGSDPNLANQATQTTGKTHNVPILPLPSNAQSSQLAPTTTLLITASNTNPNQILLNSVHSSMNVGGSSMGVGSVVGKISDTASDSSTVPSPVSLSLSPLSVENMSPPRSLSGKSDSDHRGMKVSGRGEHRRVCHINAEQKRRCNIKNGFDMLHSLIPALSQNPNAKTSKAAMLQKGAEYIKQLRSERNQLKEEMDSLRQQIDGLNTAISNCQSMLPATGAPVSRHRSSKIREMFDEYVRVRTLENWKFWVFSLMIEPLLGTFNSSVSTSSMEELYRTTLQWVDQHCSLVELRPVVMNSLRVLSTSTDILVDPSRLPGEARQSVMKTDLTSSGSSTSSGGAHHQPH